MRLSGYYHSRTRNYPASVCNAERRDNSGKDEPHNTTENGVESHTDEQDMAKVPKQSTPASSVIL